MPRGGGGPAGLLAKGVVGAMGYTSELRAANADRKARQQQQRQDSEASTSSQQSGSSRKKSGHSSGSSTPKSATSADVSRTTSEKSVPTKSQLGIYEDAPPPYSAEDSDDGGAAEWAGMTVHDTPQDLAKDTGMPVEKATAGMDEKVPILKEGSEEDDSDDDPDLEIDENGKSNIANSQDIDKVKKSKLTLIEKIDNLVTNTLEKCPSVDTLDPNVKRTPMSYPIILPQRRPGEASRGFLRAYSPVLQEKGISQLTFHRYLKNLQRANQESPWIDYIILGSAIAGFVPGIAMMIASTVVQFAAQAAANMQRRARSNNFIERMNQELFMPRGLFAVVLKYKPDSDRPLQVQRFDLKNHMEASAAATGMSKFKYKFKHEAGTTYGDLEFPDSAPLYLLEKDKLKKFDDSKWTTRTGNVLGDYKDRRAQAKYAAENPDSVLAMKGEDRPEFASIWSDPNHAVHTAAASGDLLGVVSGGKLAGVMGGGQRNIGGGGGRRDRRNGPGGPIGLAFKMGQLGYNKYQESQAKKAEQQAAIMAAAYDQQDQQLQQQAEMTAAAYDQRDPAQRQQAAQMAAVYEQQRKANQQQAAMMAAAYGQPTNQYAQYEGRGSNNSLSPYGSPGQPRSRGQSPSLKNARSFDRSQGSYDDEQYYSDDYGDSRRRRQDRYESSSSGRDYYGNDQYAMNPYNGGRRNRSQDRRMQQYQPYGPPANQQRGGALGGLGAIKAKLKTGVLYMMIVNLPTEEEAAHADDELRKAGLMA